MSEVCIVERTAGTIHLEVETSLGTVEIMADFAWFPDVRTMVFDKAHLEGEGPGILGRKGVNEIKTALAEFGGQHGAKVVVFQGNRRTSGRLVGKVPTVITIQCS